MKSFSEALVWITLIICSFAYCTRHEWAPMIKRTNAEVSK